MLSFTASSIQSSWREKINQTALSKEPARRGEAKTPLTSQELQVSSSSLLTPAALHQAEPTQSPLHSPFGLLKAQLAIAEAPGSPFMATARWIPSLHLSMRQKVLSSSLKGFWAGAQPLWIHLLKKKEVQARTTASKESRFLHPLSAAVRRSTKNPSTSNTFNVSDPKHLHTQSL